MGKSKKPKRKPSAYNRHIGREMKAGRTMKQAAASWKKGSKKSSPKKRASRTTKGGRKSVSRKGGFNTQKLFKFVRMGALLMPAAQIATSSLSNEEKWKQARSAYFGVRSDGTVHLEDLKRGWLPYLMSIGVTYGIPKIAGIIRSL